MKITGSRLPLASRCIGAVVLPVVHTTSDAAESGTGRHTYLRRVAAVGRDAALAEIPEGADWRETCEAIDVDAIPSGQWETSFAYHPETDTARVLGTDRDYSYANTDEITGTADLIARTDDGAARPWLIDFKGSEAVDAPAENLQLSFYALCHARVMGYDDIKVSICNIHNDGRLEWSHARFDGWDLETIASKVRMLWTRAQAARETYVTGGLTPDLAAGMHCRYCPAMPMCPAQVTLAYELVTARDEMTAETILALSDEKAGEAWVKVAQYQQVLARIEAALRERALIKGLPLPGGAQLVVQESTRRVLDVEKTLPVLRGIVGERADTFVERSIASSVVETVSREVAKARGVTLKDVRNDLWSQLRGGGAVREQNYVQLRVKKPKAASKTIDNEQQEDM